MHIPDASSPFWISAVTSERTYELEFLAMKILLARLRLAVKQDASPESIQKCAHELRELFLKSQHLPKAQNDLKRMIQEGGMS
ncbi:MAG TPA: hypothetical protein PKM65_14205 [Spirochaetota bacterium]|nr:hypothetical protein [Spirochaetota bacterium]HNT12916.1 hypothetical protein [Spirochaetota bacterium]HNV46713.1 hypothetical protein [Spirochaetota bacterium]HOS38889.1 hypothetical protein [Spirochaetota bacterium]HPU87399.1 hypothetical protein [Spirochaetota bacterium]